MSFNLTTQLTAEDRIKIENYIHEYGTMQNFIGIDEWLKYWGKENIKLYKLFGNQFIYRIPFTYDKPENELRRQIAGLLYPAGEKSFKDYFWEWAEKNFSGDDRRAIWWYVDDEVLEKEVLVKDRIATSFRFKLEGSNKTLQLQEGMKPIRAISRLLNYFKGQIDGTDELINRFEKFRIAHSLILNDKIVKGTLCFSIHPLDFMTMSDNDSNWHSCMAWSNQGCYHVGTVEMMNSNNVICCYLENSNPYCFKKDCDENSRENYTWNNKRWRQLVYVTKDIIVTGKPYPYINEEISKVILVTLRELAKKNLNWTYSFGPELYQDMKYINGSYSMDRAKQYIYKKMMTKHNIIFDTKGMYNDMLNDSHTKYWCIRNKVKHNLVISYSGKAPCLCCGEPVICENDYHDDYNERYDNVCNVVCNDCLADCKCDICGESRPDRKHYTIYNSEGEGFHVCQGCVDEVFRTCPDCGKPFYLSSWWDSYSGYGLGKDPGYIRNYIKIKENPDLTETNRVKAPYPNASEEYFKTIRPICRCNSCAEKDTRFTRGEYNWEGKYSWQSWHTIFNMSKKVENIADWEDYFPENLKPARLVDGEVVTC